MVIGEYEGAFAGRQALHIIPLVPAHGVTVWLPDASGPVDLDDPTHLTLIVLVGHQSEREILRARMRTSHAMSTQARDQGRLWGAITQPNAVTWGLFKRLPDCAFENERVQATLSGC